MDKQFTAPTVYFLQEGKENLLQCLKTAFQAAKQQNVSKILIFTAKGDGVRIALESFCSQPEFSHIRLVAVTFPAAQVFRDKEGNKLESEISSGDAEFFRNSKVDIVRAHLPLDPFTPFRRRQGALGQDLSLIGEVLNLFCGSMSLCVQAIILACDAGFVAPGEHVIALTSDTAILAQASSTRRMLGDLVIREILCKPAVLSVTRQELADKLPAQMQLEMTSEIKVLPASTEVAELNTPEEDERRSEPRG